MGGVEKPRNFFSRRISLHRRKKACRIRLASRLFYAHLGFCKEVATNFLNFFKAKLGIHGISGRCRTAKGFLHGISPHCQRTKGVLCGIWGYCRAAKAVHTEFGRIVSVQRASTRNFSALSECKSASTRNFGTLSECKSRFSRKMRLALDFTNKNARFGAAYLWRCI